MAIDPDARPRHRWRISKAFFPLAALATLVCVSPAMATATLSCEAEADGLRFDFMAAVGTTGSWMNVRTALTPPPEKLGEGRLGAHSLRRDAIKFRVFWGAGEKSEAEAIVSVRSVAEDDYVGRVRLRIKRAARQKTGAARCQFGY